MAQTLAMHAVKADLNNFEHIGTIDVSDIKKIVETYDHQKWLDFDLRQKKYHVHKHTETIPLLFDADFRLSNPTYWPDAPLFAKSLEEISGIFTKYFGEGFIIRALLVKLLAKTEIAPHVDKGMSLETARRVHLPIITNDAVYFTVGDEIKNLKPGELWEINNGKKIHSVRNDSNEDRVHLIVDWQIL